MLPCIPMILIIIVNDSGHIIRIPIHNPAKSHSKVYFKEISLFFNSKSIKTKYMIKTNIRLIRSLSGIILFSSPYSKAYPANKNCQCHLNHIVDRPFQVNRTTSSCSFPHNNRYFLDSSSMHDCCYNGLRFWIVTWIVLRIYFNKFCIDRPKSTGNILHFLKTQHMDQPAQKRNSHSPCCT